jgi:hypothetical protein
MLFVWSSKIDVTFTANLVRSRSGDCPLHLLSAERFAELLVSLCRKQSIFKIGEMWWSILEDYASRSKRSKQVKEAKRMRGDKVDVISDNITGDDAGMVVARVLSTLKMNGISLYFEFDRIESTVGEFTGRFVDPLLREHLVQMFVIEKEGVGVYYDAESGEFPELADEPKSDEVEQFYFDAVEDEDQLP